MHYLSCVTSRYPLNRQLIESENWYWMVAKQTVLGVMARRRGSMLPTAVNEHIPRRYTSETAKVLDNVKISEGSCLQ